MNHNKQDQTSSQLQMIPDGEIIVDECLVEGKFDTKKKRKHYKQLYRQQWEKEPAYSSWLRGVSKDLRKAMCVACKSMMVAEITVIKNHAKGKRHLRNLEKFEQKLFNSGLHVQSNGEDIEFDFDDEYVVLHQDSDSDAERSHYKRKVKTEKSPLWMGGRGLYHNTSGMSMDDPQLLPLMPDDENDIFGKHVACELRQMEDVLTKQNTKIKISTILYEARVSLLNKGQNQRDGDNHGSNMQNYIVLNQNDSGNVPPAVE